MATTLKRLELSGFKSFANKTVLDFPSRVTAVVGPNGSGKSNIMDAFRWVLGEREAKQLRGEKLENLIFAGTPKKPAAALARVALYFDNRRRNFPVDTEEAVLARRVDRSGVSQFFWNDQEVRLRDLVPALAKSRLGSRGLMMIGQGESDIFVRTSPQERRMFVEEILGLREYRLKKNQTERQLEQSRVNLEKAKAMAAELMPHLRLLRRQKNRWEKRSQLEVELRELENNFFSSRFWEIQKNIEAVEKSGAGVEKELAEISREVAKLEGNLAKLGTPAESRDELNRLRKEVRTLLEERSLLFQELARLEARMEVAKGEPAVEPAKVLKTLIDLKKGLEELLNWEDIHKIKSGLAAWLEKIKNVLAPAGGEKDSRPASEQQNNLRRSIAAIEEKLTVFNKEEEEILTKQEEANKNFRELIETIEAKKQKRRDVEYRREKNNFEREKLELQMKELEHQFHTLGRNIAELKDLKPGSAGENKNETEDREVVERRILRLRGELAAIGEIDPSLAKEAEEAEQRYQFLEIEIKDLEKASADLKIMIKDLEAKIHGDFQKAFHAINEEFNKFFRLMFGGGRAHLKLLTPKVKEEIPEPAEEKEDKETLAGVEVELNVPKKKIKSLEMLSGGEKSLVSLAALFALISVSPPPFLVLDEIDATLDEANAQRFAQLVKEFSHQTQFIIITHNRATMEAAEVLYGITMGDDGVSKVLSLKLE